MDFDFCQLLYTAIADIYRFWLRPWQPFQDKWRPRGYLQTAPAGPGGGFNHRLRGEKGVCPGKCDQGGEGEHTGLLHTGAR